jgi:hypothetical protein
MRGYPVGTIAFYGPDNRRATKVAVGIIPAPRSEPAEMRRWFGETGDVRLDETVFAEANALGGAYDRATKDLLRPREPVPA